MYVDVCVHLFNRIMRSCGILTVESVLLFTNLFFFSDGLFIKSHHSTSRYNHGHRSLIIDQRSQRESPLAIAPSTTLRCTNEADNTYKVMNPIHALGDAVRTAMQWLRGIFQSLWLKVTSSLERKNHHVELSPLTSTASNYTELTTNTMSGRSRLLKIYRKLLLTPYSLVQNNNSSSSDDVMRYYSAKIYQDWLLLSLVCNERMDGGSEENRMSLLMPFYFVNTVKTKSVPMTLDQQTHLLFKYFDTFDRAPKRSEKYRDQNIGKFYHWLLSSVTSTQDALYGELAKHPKVKERLDIHLLLHSNTGSIQEDSLSYDDKVQLLFEYCSEHHKPPKPTLVYKNQRIGQFLHEEKQKIISSSSSSTSSVGDETYHLLSQHPVVARYIDKYLHRRHVVVKKTALG